MAAPANDTRTPASLVIPKPVYFNPFTAPACQIAGLKNARTHLQTVYFPVTFLAHRLSGPHVLMTILSHASAKKKTKRLLKKWFQIWPFYWSFPCDIMAVNGLK